MKYATIFLAFAFLSLHLSAQNSKRSFLLGTDTQVVDQTPTGTRSCVLLPLQNHSTLPGGTIPDRGQFFKEKLTQVPLLNYAPPPSHMGKGIALGAAAGFFTGLAVGLILGNKDGSCNGPNCIRVSSSSVGLVLGLVGILPGMGVGGFIGAWPRNEKASGD